MDEEREREREREIEGQRTWTLFRKTNYSKTFNGDDPSLERMLEPHISIGELF